METFCDFFTTLYHSLGLLKTDNVLFHVDSRRLIRHLKKIHPSLDKSALLPNFTKYFDIEATLAFPTFSFQALQHGFFDYVNTPSEMGLITELARRCPDFNRTYHPVYSFAIRGPLAGNFLRLSNITAYGPDSPFKLFRDFNFKIVVISLPENRSMTSYHHAEEMFSARYRYQKSFNLLYIDHTGESSRKTFKIYVRNLDQGVVTHVEPMKDLLISRGLYTLTPVDFPIPARAISSQQLFHATTDVLSAGAAEGLLWRYSAEIR